jgi:hypothetical protein
MTPQHDPSPGQTVPCGQRFGRITYRQPSGSGPVPGRAPTTSRTTRPAVSTFSYADIVTEGFRTIRTGVRVRSLTGPASPGRATYVIRLDQPATEDYYR